MAEQWVGYRMRDKSLDELMDDVDRGVHEGAGKGPEHVAIGFQYRVAKAQERSAWISAWISGASLAVAIAAVIVAAVK